MRPWLVLLTLGAGCAPDTALKTYNNDPVATIVSHEDGDEVREGYAVSFLGTLSDANNQADQLTATWYSGATTLCEEAPVDAAGSATCTAVLTPDDTEITLQARDPANATGLARVTLVIVPTDAPVATITAPDGTGPYYNDVPVQIGGTVSDAEDAVAELVAAWTDGDGIALAADTTPDGSGALTDTLLFATGTQTLTLSVTDQTGKTGADSVSFVVGGANTPPSCTIRTPAEGAAAEPGDRVTLAGVVTDPDVDASRRTATWSSGRQHAPGRPRDRLGE